MAATKEKKNSTQRTRRTGETLFFEVVDDTIDPVDQSWDIVVDQEAKTYVLESKVRQQLLFIDGCNVRFRLIVDDDLPFND